MVANVGLVRCKPTAMTIPFVIFDRSIFVDWTLFRSFQDLSLKCLHG